MGFEQVVDLSKRRFCVLFSRVWPRQDKEKEIFFVGLLEGKQVDGCCAGIAAVSMKLTCCKRCFGMGGMFVDGCCWKCAGGFVCNRPV